MKTQCSVALRQASFIRLGQELTCLASSPIDAVVVPSSHSQIISDLNLQLNYSSLLEWAGACQSLKFQGSSSKVAFELRVLNLDLVFLITGC